MHLSPTAPSSTRLSDAARPAASITRDWTCPFCALLCDDLAIESHEGGRLAAPAANCPRLAQALACYGEADARGRCSVGANDTDLDTALTHAAQLLAKAQRPLFGSLATDVAGARALYTLAAGCGAILDHLHGDALSAATLALQDRGAFFTTLSEVRTRADLVVFFGCQPSRRYPRFFERTLAASPMARDLVFVGCEPDVAAPGLAQARVEAILPDADPFDTLALWSALSEGRAPGALRGGAAHPADAAGTLAALQARIAAARYTVLVYEPAALPGPHAALLIEALHRIVKAANRTVRAGCLALGGDEGALSVNQTVTWLSGLPLRTHVAAPLDHNPHRYRTARLLANGEIDALLWVASFAPPAALPEISGDLPAIVLGHPALAQAAKARGGATVFIPVATPGIDCGGHLFRTDGPVVTPLAAARRAPLPSVATVVAQLTARLNAERTAQEQP
ncbi:formylmethanofuran dehydrogenase subunit B [Paraburkholderia unamae]|uniref:formylmethanofuran dehydrogenase n=1 Tax=Paraburkholderia unamae TaxID=219649 RepID=UPI000DC3532B|nr:formylmethanofuran dehydrogenase [Paraburkholderia unamae]RAR56565.1 formylmethanofuran dehydrogenase subunit B [Paraburkholderia unamae]